MGNVNASGIWTPDDADNLDPEVWASTMADSIHNGIGERLNKQESKVSLRATTPIPFDVQSTSASQPYTRIPLNANGVTGSRAPEPDFAGGNHVTGITLENNVATVITSGLYTITGQITVIKGTFAVHSFDFIGKVNGSTFGLPAYGATSTVAYSSGIVSDTRYLVAGDNIELIVGVGTDHIGGIRVQDALLSVSIAYAT